jgi:hypothetical protein
MASPLGMAVSLSSCRNTSNIIDQQLKNVNWDSAQNTFAKHLKAMLSYGLLRDNR